MGRPGGAAWRYSRKQVLVKASLTAVEQQHVGKERELWRLLWLGIQNGARTPRQAIEEARICAGS